MESHAAVSDATAAFVRFSIAAAVMLPFADWKEKAVLFAGKIRHADYHNGVLQFIASLEMDPRWPGSILFAMLMLMRDIIYQHWEN